MKIGILTYHCVPNFGAQLQTLSTVWYLRNHGHEPYVINWYPKDLEELYRPSIPKEQMEAFKMFVYNNMPLTERCCTEEELVEIVDRYQFDFIVHGSDAIFKYQPERLRRHFRKRSLRWTVYPAWISIEGLEGNPFFGAYISKLKKKTTCVAYAVSSQNCQYKLITRLEKKRFKECLANFRQISARDSWTRDMIMELDGNREVPICPDPVFGFKYNCEGLVISENDLRRKYNLPSKYVLMSFRTDVLPDGYIFELSKEFEDKGYCIIGLPMPEGNCRLNLKRMIPSPITPLEWYSLIRYSKGYVGERMHPIIVCLHNVVPFFCFDEYGTVDKKTLFSRKKFSYKSSKIVQLLSEADLLEQMHSYNDNDLPSVDTIAHKVLGFDKERCCHFAERQYHKYVESMEKILSI